MKNRFWSKILALSLLWGIGHQAAWAQEPVFSVPHGLFSNIFSLSITSPIQGAEIYFTKDGSDPRVNGEPYRGEFAVDKTCVLRAVALLPDSTWTTISTQSYIFPKQVLLQNNRPSGYPAFWGPYCSISGTAIADYEMDPEIARFSVYQDKLLAGFEQIPIVSLVTDKDNFFSMSTDPDTGGIYIYTGAPIGSGIGRGWERPVSMEMFHENEDISVTVDCGVKLHGGHGRVPEKNPKHAFRLHFRTQYGPGKLHYPVFGMRGGSVHNSLVLRTFFGYSWVHWENAQREKAQYSRDMWARCMQARMGHPVSIGRHVHLFINGLYWGLYNLCERVDDDFCAQKMGGKADQWDVTEVDGGAGNYHAAIAAEGNVEDWNKMADYIYSLPDDFTAYYHLKGQSDYGAPSSDYPALLDMENFMDYMLINFYAGNTDWDHHNWYAARNRENPGKGFRFFCWDTEAIFDNPNENLTTKNNRGCPTGMFNRLMKHRLFAHQFHARAQELLFHDGLLTPSQVEAIWDSIYYSIDNSLYLESARWGDYRRDVHPYSSTGSLYTVDKQFTVERMRLHQAYFPFRTRTLISQLRSRGWFPAAEAPEFYLDDVNIGYAPVLFHENSVLNIEGDEVYYTIEGSQPVSWVNREDGLISTRAIRLVSGHNILKDFPKPYQSDTLVVKAISRTKGEWSPIVTVRLVPEILNGVLRPKSAAPRQPGIYSLQGMRLPSLPQRGFYIRVTEDGKVRKEYVTK